MCGEFPVEPVGSDRYDLGDLLQIVCRLSIHSLKRHTYASSGWVCALLKFGPLAIYSYRHMCSALFIEPFRIGTYGILGAVLAFPA